jgi:mRNA deadenylase 3'-5' endonuclease subunit Ccr4
VERKFRPAANRASEYQKPVEQSKIIHVMSYNVLADRLALSHIFTHTTRSVLAFNFRGPRIIAEIRESKADILCLQEVDRISDFYEPMLSALGYKLLHYGRPGLFRGEGIAIAYKTDKFNLIERENINFDDLSNVYPGGGAFRRGNQAMLCLFEFKSCKTKVIAGCTHLHFNPKLDFVKHA